MPSLIHVRLRSLEHRGFHNNRLTIGCSSSYVSIKNILSFPYILERHSERISTIYVFQ